MTQQPTIPEFSRDDVELIERKTAWQGYYRMVVYRLRYRRFDGGWSNEIEREVFERGIAAAVVPYDPVRDEVVLIRQFRPGAYAAGMTPWLWEVVAGIIEPGETPLEVVTREATEEAALAIENPIRICQYLVSPGGTSEVCTLFCARVDSSEAGGIHGLASENEDIAVKAVPFAQVMQMLTDDLFNNAKTIIGLQWLALHRERLRQNWA
ncbi:MAG: NUDIX domain-containing protein [Rhodospirillales bacterium]